MLQINCEEIQCSYLKKKYIRYEMWIIYETNIGKEQIKGNIRRKHSEARSVCLCKEQTLLQHTKWQETWSSLDTLSSICMRLVLNPNPMHGMLISPCKANIHWGCSWLPLICLYNQQLIIGGHQVRAYCRPPWTNEHIQVDICKVTSPIRLIYFGSHQQCCLLTK